MHCCNLIRKKSYGLKKYEGNMNLQIRELLPLFDPLHHALTFRNKNSWLGNGIKTKKNSFHDFFPPSLYKILKYYSLKKTNIKQL